MILRADWAISLDRVWRKCFGMFFVISKTYEHSSLALVIAIKSLSASVAFGFFVLENPFLLIK